MKKIVVIRPTSSNIYLSVLRGNNIDKNIIIPIEPNTGLSPENMKEIRKALKEEGVRNCPAGTIIPDNKCIFRTVQTDSNEYEAIKEAVFLSMDINDEEETGKYVFDYKQIERSENGYKWFCVIADKTLVTDYKALFIRYGLKLDYLIPETVAIGNLIKNAGKTTDNSIFIDYEKESIIIRAFKGTECVAEHEIDYNEEDSRQNIGNVKLTLDYYDDNAITNTGNSGIYVYGEIANSMNTLYELREELDLDIHPVRDFINGPISNNDASRIFPAIGSICNEDRII